MKNFQKCKFISLVVLFSGLLTFPLSNHLEAQDSAKIKEKKGIVVLKIKKDDNGKTTVIDTTFHIKASGDQKELDEFLKNHEIDFKSQNDELENIKVYVDMADFSDSIINDSVRKYVKIIDRDVRYPQFRWKEMEGGFDYNYDFDIPCPPDVPPPPSYPDYKGFDREFTPGADMRMLRYGNKRQTLGDIIGDIPMDRVKSYSIKDKKNGKRIVIDIEDAPLLEKHNKIIIMHEPGRSYRNGNKSGRQMKVMINSEKDRQIETPTEPPPPPPPPPSPKEKDGK